MKSNNNMLYLIIIIIVILMLIFVRQTEEKIDAIEEMKEDAISEESAGSGMLEVETFPGNADIYVDRLYSGKSPVTLYNIPAGSRNIIIKKEGYKDFASQVDIGAGKKSFLEASLILAQVEEDVKVIVAEEEVELIEIIEEKKEEDTLKPGNLVNVGNKLWLYYDFSEKGFSDIRQQDSDVFSKRFDTYLVFTRFNPVKIKSIDQSIDDVEKEDCVGIQGRFEYLYSGQSLCVITKENSIVAIGGDWEDTENAGLIWKMFR